MDGDKDVLWGMYQEHTTQGRHHESQRSTMTNLFLAICAGVLGLFSLENNASFIHIVLSCFLIFLGIFGAIFSAKHYERFRMHMERARGYRNALDGLIPDTSIMLIKKTADNISVDKYPKLFHLRLFKFWIALHLSVSAVGCILLIWSIFSIACTEN